MFVILFALILVSSARELHLPSYIKGCDILDPNFGKCAQERAEIAIPFLIKGDRKYNIPQLDPLILQKIGFTLFNSFNVSASNMNIQGLRTFKPELISFNKTDGKFKIEGVLEKLNAKSKYGVTGKLLSFQVEGDGDLTADFGEISVMYEALLKDFEKKGKNYLRLDSDQISFDAKNLSIHMTNLFGGDKAIEEQMDRFLNENWREVLTELTPTISEIVRSIVRRAVSELIQEIPANEIFINYTKK